jgi:hypothetical protein
VDYDALRYKLLNQYYKWSYKIDRLKVWWNNKKDQGFQMCEKKMVKIIKGWNNIQGGPKRSLWCVWEILKYFLMESFSLYIHILSRS